MSNFALKFCPQNFKRLNSAINLRFKTLQAEVCEPPGESLIIHRRILMFVRQNFNHRVSGADICGYEAEMPIVASSTGEVMGPTIVRIHANIAITSEACFLMA